MRGSRGNAVLSGLWTTRDGQKGKEILRFKTGGIVNDLELGSKYPLCREIC